MARGTNDDKPKNGENRGDSCENDPPEDTAIVPPDGGWGWMIVLGSFMIHIVTDGVTYSFGIFYSEYLRYFREGNGKTSWIASILVGVTLCSGPISSSIVNKYGCRPVTIAGAILASICLLLSFFAQNVLTLYFTIGLGTGFGFGLIYLPAIVSVTCYFEKYRSLATGIAVCGSGLGTVIFSPLTDQLIDQYGWRGAVMIISGIVLNCVVFGALFRPLEPKKKKEIPLVTINAATEDDRCKVAWSNGAATPMLNGSCGSPNTTVKHANDIERPRSATNVARAKYTAVKSGEDVNYNMRVALSQPTLDGKNLGQQTESMTRSYGSGIMSRRDVFYQGSLENVQARSRSLGNSVDNVRIYSSLRSLPNTNGKNTGDLERLPEEKSNIVREMLDLSLLRDAVFLLFTLSNFCTSIGFNVPYVYLPAQAEDKNIDKVDASYLLAIVGGANTVGRIALGYIADKPWVNRLLIYNCCLTLCGIATMLSSVCTSFATFAIYSIVFGVTAGAYVGLTSVILVDLLGLDRLTNAFGLLLLFQGVASLLGPPIAGWLKDSIGSYDPGFLLAGAMIGVSGLMLFLIPTIQRRIERKNKKLQRTMVST